MGVDISGRNPKTKLKKVIILELIGGDGDLS